MSFRVFCPKLAKKWPLKWAPANSNFAFYHPPPSAGAYTAVGTETGANAGAKANGEWFGVDIDVEINVKWVDNNSKIDPQMR